MRGYASVDAYIRASPKGVQAGLKQIRRALRLGAPKAEEKVSYGMPGLRLGGMLLYFAAFKDHYSLFLPYGTASRKFKAALAGYRSTRVTYHLPLDAKLPLALLRRIAAHAQAEKLSQAPRPRRPQKKKKP